MFRMRRQRVGAQRTAVRESLRRHRPAAHTTDILRLRHQQSFLHPRCNNGDASHTLITAHRALCTHHIQLAIAARPWQRCTDSIQQVHHHLQIGQAGQSAAGCVHKQPHEVQMRAAAMPQLAPSQIWWSNQSQWNQYQIVGSNQDPYHCACPRKTVTGHPDCQPPITNEDESGSETGES